jgi:hypothetical protein
LKIIYVAENSIDAHVLVQRLAQRDIEAYVEGAHLQSAFGNMGFSGVRVVCDDVNFDRGRAIAVEWERERTGKSTEHTDIGQEFESQASNGEAVHKLKSKVRTHSPLEMAAAFALGMLAMWGAEQMRRTVNTEDTNNDGKRDLAFTYNSRGILASSWQDRNFDGEKDALEYYSSSGVYESGEYDDDFDGRFEGQAEKRGESLIVRYDRDNDGHFEVKMTSIFDVLATEEYFRDERLERVIHYKNGFAERSEDDLDGDGALETKRVFDAFGRELPLK